MLWGGHTGQFSPVNRGGAVPGCWRCLLFPRWFCVISLRLRGVPVQRHWDAKQLDDAVLWVFEPVGHGVYNQIAIPLYLVFRKDLERGKLFERLGGHSLGDSHHRWVAKDFKRRAVAFWACSSR